MFLLQGHKFLGDSANLNLVVNWRFVVAKVTVASKHLRYAELWSEGCVKRVSLSSPDLIQLSLLAELSIETRRKVRTDLREGHGVAGDESTERNGPFNWIF